MINVSKNSQFWLNGHILCILAPEKVQIYVFNWEELKSADVRNGPFWKERLDNSATEGRSDLQKVPNHAFNIDLKSPKIIS